MIKREGKQIFLNFFFSFKSEWHRKEKKWSYVKLKAILKFWRMVSYAGFYCFISLISQAYISNMYYYPLFLSSYLFRDLFVWREFFNLFFVFGLCYRTRARTSRANRFYASYLARTNTLVDIVKVRLTSCILL